MFEQVLNSPIVFWIACIVLIGLVLEGVQNWNLPWAKPALVVYGTIGVWYIGDYVLAEAREYLEFEPWVIELGYLQVTAFLLLFRLFLSQLAPRFCRGLSTHGATRAIPRHVLRRSLKLVSAAWLVLFLMGAGIRHGEWWPLLWPPARDEKLGMFVHPGVGGGLSFLLATLGYIHVLVCAFFGALFVLGKGQDRMFALVMILLSWPYFFFDRARNVMLALILPAIACYWIFYRQDFAKKAVVSVLLFLGVLFWFERVMAYRSEGTKNLQVFTEISVGQGKQHGLDMMKELCWVNTFLQDGRYRVNWGARYFGEAVNFVPRTIWPNKPKVGFDYAIARGFLSQDKLSITASIATGMIGQGLVNFGPYLGVVAAALLMATWAAILARLWCQREHVGRMLLFLIGMGLTFNMGRDITLLVLFPFVFGYVGVRIFEMVETRKATDSHVLVAKQPRTKSTP